MSVLYGLNISNNGSAITSPQLTFSFYRLFSLLPLSNLSRHQLHKIVANKQECKVLGTSVEEEAKQACAYIPDDFGDGF